jgi:hypothetical protein
MGVCGKGSCPFFFLIIQRYTALLHVQEKKDAPTLDKILACSIKILATLISCDDSSICIHA